MKGEFLLKSTSKSVTIVFLIFVMVSVHVSRAVDRVGSSPDRVKLKAIKLVFVASLLSTQH